MTASHSPLPDEIRLAEARRKRAIRILILIAALFVIVPFLFWRGTWFGRPLTEEEIGKYLADKEKPRKSQHALAQIAERIGRGDLTVKRWYPQISRLAASPVPEIRVTLAWVMGGDNHSEEFHRALLDLLKDPEPLVRRNAALSLVRFGDSSGNPELLGMLRPYTIGAPREGTLRYRLHEGDSVDRGTLLARLEVGGEEPLEVRSPLPGKLETKLAKEGARVAAGEEILALSPGEEHVWEALRALYLVGQTQDLLDIERFARGAVDGMPVRVQQQAVLTAAEIRHRAREEQKEKQEVGIRAGDQ